MEDDSKFGSMVKWGLGAVGLGGVMAVVSFDNKRHGILVALAILVLFLLVFGGYYLWRRMRARRQSKMFSSAIEAQTAAAPRAISDPNQRAALDKLRQKFQTGMQEFKSRGKDIYKLPWYVIIGESGSGKSEAIRHSGIEFPPGLQDEMQGSGGTVNMDWWFTNRAIILDTAGSMIFREAQAGSSPEWGEFLRLLKKSRPQCPINGLFLVLSIESLIHDSADKISEKASKLAQQLQLIQRTLDVRFPVYLLVTKADLLTGFREFFDNIEDPLLQHQMFGWSNPDPLDSHLRPDLVEQHLKSVADRLRRRRLALILRETSSGARLGETTFFSASSQPLGGRGDLRRLDDMDALFALPESVMRLVPRLRRYLETVFVAGEWSAKPVFLRGIYFTSSMREGKALDEAMALATGLSVDQLPEDRTWEKNRAFFLRDLFVEKVFRESGLVTRATNTIQLLRKRQFAIFGTAGLAMLLLIVFAGIGYGNLKDSVLKEVVEWEAGAKGWDQQGVWTLPIVRLVSDDVSRFTYAATNQEVKVGLRTMSVVDYHQHLKAVAAKSWSTTWVFKPVSRLKSNLGEQRKTAQRILFEQGVLKPLVDGTRGKMGREPDAAGVGRHQNALLSLIRLQADNADRSKFASGLGTNTAANYLNSFLAYLTDSDASLAGANLVDIFNWTYSKDGGKPKGDVESKSWPPPFLVGKDDLANNPAIRDGLEGLRKANVETEVGISNRLTALNDLTADFVKYRETEQKVFNSTGNFCDAILSLRTAREVVGNSQDRLHSAASNLGRPLTNLSACYDNLANEAASASGLTIERNLDFFPESFKTNLLYGQIKDRLNTFKKQAADSVKAARSQRDKDIADLDLNYISFPPGGADAAYQLRWGLFQGSCSLLTNQVVANDGIIGNLGQRFISLSTNALNVANGLQTYRGPFAAQVSNICTRIMGQNADQLKTQLVENYARHVKKKLSELKFPLHLDSPEPFTGAELVAVKKSLIRGLEADVNNSVWQSFPASAAILATLGVNSLTNVVNGLVNQDYSIAQVEIRFTPPNSGWRDPNLRHAKLFVDGSEQKIIGGTRPGDLSSIEKPSTPIATPIPISAGLRFEFFSDRDKTINTATFKLGGNEDNWTLIRLIKAGQAEQINDKGTEWRLKMPVSITGQPRTLEVFEIHLTNPLPKKENWPQ